MLSERAVNDVSSVEIMKTHHANLKAEIDAREDIFSSVIETGNAMVAQQHFASNDVSRQRLIWWYK